MAGDAEMKNTCGAEGLGRDLLSPCVVFLSAPSWRHLQHPADSTMSSSPVDLLWFSPQSTLQPPAWSGQGQADGQH